MKHSFRKSQVNVCLVCILKPLANTTMKTLCTQMSGKHLKDDNISDPFHIKKPRFYIIVLSILMAFVILSIFWDIYCLYSISGKNIPISMFLLSLVVPEIGGMLIFAVTIERYHSILDSLNSWYYILEDLVKEGTADIQLQTFSKTSHSRCVALVFKLILHHSIQCYMFIVAIQEKGKNFGT